MLPLAVILKGMGYTVSGSDRSYDQGRTPEKFKWIQDQGITLYPQDGSGITPAVSTLVISKAVEDTIPDIAAAKAQGVPILKRADILIELFNASQKRIAVSGTSGKTTTTGMIGFLFKEAGLDPTVMNGGIFRNYVSQNPYSTAFVGKGNVFVTEVDESDGIDVVASYEPDIAVIHNITLDHQPMVELMEMFSGFLARTGTAVLNVQDDNVLKIAGGFAGKILTYGVDVEKADVIGCDVTPHESGIDATVSYGGTNVRLELSVPGKHNVSNALAAITVGLAMGIDIERSCEILSRFTGIRRRMEIVGVKNGVTVMDDFAHNPDKIAATLGTLKEFSGPLHIFFQPHGYGFLKMMGEEVAQAFAQHMDVNDTLYMVEPFYTGGTVDRSVGSSHVVASIVDKGANAHLMEGRPEVLRAILQAVKSGDRIIIMGARDDSLSAFAAEILDSLG